MLSIPRTVCLAALLLLLLTVPAAYGQARVIIIDRPGEPTGATLDTRTHHVTATINGQVATTTIEQVFYNPTRQRLEGHFMLPIPADTLVDRFTMDINGKPTEAELLDADKARQIYEDIVRQMRDPALLEFADHQLLKARIFPIEPQSETRIKLTYTHLLPSDAGTVRYVYPLRGRTVQGRSDMPLTMELELRSEQPMSSIYSPSHDVEIVRHDRRHATVGMETKDAGDTDFTLYFAPQRDAQGVDFQVLTYRDGEADPLGSDAGYFLMLLSPGSLGDDEKPLPKDIVFVLDTSGSMSGGKLEQAKRALIFCLDNLNDEDRFEIVRFSSDVELLFDSLQTATAEHRAQAQTFVKALRPVGGTAVHDAITQTLDMLDEHADEDDRPRMVVFLTDGQPTVGNRDIDAIVNATRDKSDTVRVFSFGLGHDVNTHLLDRMAEATRAVSEYVLPEEDIELKVSNFYGKIAEPVLAELKIATLEDGDVRLSRLYPDTLPDLFKGDQLVVLGRYIGSGDAVIAVTGSARGETQRFTQEVRLADEDEQHDFVPRLWAMRRVGHLLDQVRLHGDSKELREEIALLGRAFNIITPQTAYLIIEDENERNVPLARQTAPAVMDSRMGLDLGSLETTRERLRENWDYQQQAQSGERAVAGAQGTRGLKEAESMDSYARSSSRLVDAAEPMAAAAPRRDGRAEAEPADALPRAQQARHMRGRTFVQHGEQWVDTTVQQLPANAEPERIAFGSERYFDLLREHPEAAEWLSVGRELQVVIAGQLYEIHDTEPEPADG